MKGVPLGLIYEECYVADLSLYKIELLYLEKVVYNSVQREHVELGIFETNHLISINPVSLLSTNIGGEIECVYCRQKKNIGEKCNYCGFDPFEEE